MKSIHKFDGRALLVRAAFLVPLACQAASDGTVTINGKIVNETCAISNPSFTVTLPTVSKNKLSAVNEVAGLTQFSIVVGTCSQVNAGGVSAYFEPDPNQVNAAGRLKNTGSATNVDVELLNSALTIMDLTKSSGFQSSTSVNVTADGPGPTLTYYARYKATGAVGFGSVASSVTYTLTYP
jgi:major type 1 subunit fimbrin (pilin)